MNIQPLIEAVVEAAVFFGLADDNQIKPDIAVAQLEQLGFILRKLSPAEREEFGKYVSQLAREEGAKGSTERVQFLESMLENLGLD